jgi:hypothetical protein
LLYPSRTGWSLLSDFPRKGQVPLHEFLTGALQQIRELDEKLDFSTIVSWLIDAEFSASLQPKFLLMFAAIERLRSRMSKGQPTGHLIADNFIQAIDGSLGDDLMNRIMADFPDMSSENQSVLRKNLKTLDRPPIAASLDLLCQNFGVIASTKKMAHLRSRLMHAGTLGEFSFQPALSLYKELSHVLDVCLLKALGYSGSYTHWANEWEERPVTETLDLRQSE